MQKGKKVTEKMEEEQTKRKQGSASHVAAERLFPSITSYLLLSPEPHFCPALPTPGVMALPDPSSFPCFVLKSRDFYFFLHRL